MPITLPTNTTVSVLDSKAQPLVGLSNLPAFKMPYDENLTISRGTPAGKGFTFRFPDLVDATHWSFLMEGASRYRVVGIKNYQTPLGAHTRIEAELPQGT